MHIGELLGNKCRCDSDRTHATIGFDGFDMCNEFTMIRTVVHPITLEKGKKFLVRCNRSHDALSFGVIRAAEALD